MRNYKVPVVMLERDSGVESVCRVFETINSTGTRLTTFDLAVARFYPQPDLRGLWADAQEEHPILKNFGVECRLLETIPGIDHTSACAILGEMGPDPNVFGAASRLAAWAGLCPGNNESAGKRRTGRARRGCRTLRAVLVECAHAAARTKNCQFQAYQKALTVRRGYKRAVVATAHKLARCAFRGTGRCGGTMGPSRRGRTRTRRFVSGASTGSWKRHASWRSVTTGTLCECIGCSRRAHGRSASEERILGRSNAVVPTQGGTAVFRRVML